MHSPNPQGFPHQMLEAPSPQLAFVELERDARMRFAHLAQIDPKGQRATTVFDRGVDASYRFVALKAKGRPTIRFCWTVNRNAAGRFLIFRETVTATGARRDRFEPILDKRAAIAACKLYKADLLAERAKAAEKARQRSLAVVPVSLPEMTDAAMAALSRLSAAAHAAGEERTMYAANRAWRELDRAKRPPERDLVS
jgi:hypothetical protein